MVTRSVFPPVCAAAAACAVSYYGLFALEQGCGLSFRIFVPVLLSVTALLSFFEVTLPRTFVRYAAATGIGLVLGLSAHYAAADAPPGGLPAGEITALEGVLLDDPRGIQARGSIQGMGRIELAKIYGGNGLELVPGWRAARIRVFFDGENLPRLADFGRKSVLYVEGVFSGGYFRARSVHVLSPPPQRERARTAFRMTLLEKFSRHEWGSLAQAVLLGVRDNLDTGLAGAFTASGCAHVLALSGMHLGVIAGLLSLLLKKPLGLKKAALLGAVLVLGYVYLVGPQASLVRSLIMYLIGVLVIFKGFPRRGETILAMAFMAQLVLFPSSGRELSFALSYLALLGLLTAGPWVYELVRGKIPPIAAGPLSASAGAFLVTSPLSALCFGVLYPGGILVALVISPLITFFMVLALIWLFVDVVFPTAALALTMPLSVLYRTLQTVSGAAGLFPSIPVRGAPAVLAAALAALALLYIGQRKMSLMRKRLEPFG
ncbi:MAG: ComEC/Rec2 family competence protein [Spirochaetaceae bacterium]|jgi:competence protein ComEC|nr:ComEC/Rec2 family competence protein [Spirochaetaceae bacterium]